MADIRRIGVGNSKFAAITENDIKEPNIPFEFSTNEITFDQEDRTFDENQTEVILFEFSTDVIFFNDDLRTFDEN
jgi:hypothetical protein